jgi:hypothetical protein
MNRILFAVLAGLLILSILTTGGCGPCHNYWAPIEDVVAIWVDEFVPPRYVLDVVSGCFTCEDDGSDYEVTHAGNTTIIVEIWKGTCAYDCPPDGPPDGYVEHSIPLGYVDYDFVPGVNYTVKVNDVTVTFVAGVTIYPAPIHDVEIWADNSSPSQYFVEVVSGEPSICDHFDSYNVTRASNTTIIVDIFNQRCGRGCPAVYRYVYNTIPLGNDFVPGGNYTVVVNDVTETFVAQ